MSSPQRNFSEFQALGFDRHSLVGDPLFADLASGDFRLQPRSPALKLGFERLLVERMVAPAPICRGADCLAAVFAAAEAGIVWRAEDRMVLLRSSVKMAPSYCCRFPTLFAMSCLLYAMSCLLYDIVSL